VREAAGSTNQSITSGANIGTSPVLLTGIADLEAGTMAQWINGTLDGEDLATGMTEGFEASPPDAVVIGARNRNGVDPFRGSISEIVVTSTALSQENRQRLEGYLAHKWGMADQLPSTHPYATNPPQSGDCSPTLLVNSSVGLIDAAGAATPIGVTVEASDGTCVAWSVTSSAEWIQLIGAGSLQTPGHFEYTVQMNPGIWPRAATLTVTSMAGIQTVIDVEQQSACEMQSANDCDEDGIPDPCELLWGYETDVNNDLVPDSCQSCAGDLNGDGIVDGIDLATMLGCWGDECSDLDGDRHTDGVDLAILLGAWGLCE
jgi:hypothetical protein